MDSFLIFLQDFTGADGTNAEIIKTKGHRDPVDNQQCVYLDRNMQILGVIKGQSKTEIERYRTKK